MISINGELFNNEEFHNGEVIFKETEIINQDNNVIEMKFKDNKDITALLFAKQWLDDVAPEATCDLVMAYCPYERMDRAINNQLFSMKYFAEILGKFNFNKVYILDPHSNVCVEQLKKSGVKVFEQSLVYYLKKVIYEFNPDYLCYPDAGAYKKYSEQLKHLVDNSGNTIKHFYGSKVRDLANNGKITSYELVDAPDLTGKKVLIIDDICCLGGTAYNAATEMKKLGASEVAFYISHCEDGIFVGKVLKPETLYEHRKVTGDMYNTHGEKTGEQKTIELSIPVGSEYIIDRVYTADTMLLSNTHPNITTVK